MFTKGLFDGKVALVTGGGTGIGLATARLLADLGARVAIAGRRPEPLAAAATELAACVGDEAVLARPCDVREHEQVTALVDAILARLGAIDLLVNNAGGQFPSPAQHITPRGFDAVVRNNLSGTFYVTREVATRSMIPRRSGAIVNVTANVFRGFPGMAHTGAARAGVENLTMTLAVEWAQHGIRVNAVAPGTIASSGTERYPKELVELARRQTPLKRLGRADEIAESIAYLLAAEYVTGETLYVDGGARLWGNLWEIPD